MAHCWYCWLLLVHWRGCRYLLVGTLLQNTQQVFFFFRSVLIVPLARLFLFVLLSLALVFSAAARTRRSVTAANAVRSATTRPRPKWTVARRVRAAIRAPAAACRIARNPQSTCRARWAPRLRGKCWSSFKKNKKKIQKKKNNKNNKNWKWKGVAMKRNA